MHTQTYILHTHTHTVYKQAKSFFNKEKNATKVRSVSKRLFFEGWFKRRNICNPAYRGQVLKAGLKEGREEPGRKRWAGPPSCLCISIDASPKMHQIVQTYMNTMYSYYVLCITYSL